MASIGGHGGVPHEEHPFVIKWGSNGAVGATEETVWSGSTLYGTTPGYPATATITKLVSSDAGDTMVVTITGNDADGLEVVQTKTLTGDTPVSLDTPLMRGYRMSVPTANAGLISATNDAGDKTFCRIEIGVQQTQMVAYSVPATLANGQTVRSAEILWLNVSSRSTNAVEVYPVVNGQRKDDFVFSGAATDRHPYGSDGVVASGIMVSPGDDIEVRAVRTGGSDATVNATFKVRIL